MVLDRTFMSHHENSCVSSPMRQIMYPGTDASSMFITRVMLCISLTQASSFFSHLVDTLGPADFLAPVSMLLVDRVSNRVVRQTSADPASTLFLPLAVCERYSAELQLLVRHW